MTITQITLVSNDVQVSTRFWLAVYPTASVEEGLEPWRKPWVRITPPAGPELLIKTAVLVSPITTIDMAVRTDPGVGDRLRAAHPGFEVAEDGTSAVDVNGTDAHVTFLLTRESEEKR